MNPAQTPELRRAIGLIQATAMVVGIMIGASIFVQPSEITGRVPSVSGIFAVWLISGLLTFVGALVCAEFASIFARSGGVFVYLREVYSPAVGFLWGWAMFWSIHSGIIAAVSVIFARYAAYFLPMGETSVKVLAIAAIAMISAINYLGVKPGSTFQTLFTIGKVIAILFIVLLGFGLGSRLPEHYVADNSANHTVSGTSFLLALVAGLFAFGGWHMVTYSSEETINPRKTIPVALMLGTIIVTICYIAVNAVYMYVLPLRIVASSTHIADQRSDRFAALATLPLNDPAASVAELDRAFNRLGFRGAMLFSNVNGVALSDRRFWPLYQKADSLNAVFFIHPSWPVGVEAMTEYWLMPLIGFTFDTTLAAAKLVFSGVTEQFPRIKWVLAHLGGAIPYLAERLDRGYFAFKECREHISKPPSEYLKQFYFDTVNFDPAALRLAIDFAGADRLVAGSDYPHQIGSLEKMIGSIKGLDIAEKEKSRIFADNAAALLGL